MKRYRNRPVEIEAVQYAWKEPYEGVCSCDSRDVRAAMADGEKVALPHVHTRTGVVGLMPGDWIVKDARGDFSVIRSGVFEQSYEPV